MGIDKSDWENNRTILVVDMGGYEEDAIYLHSTEVAEDSVKVKFVNGDRIRTISLRRIKGARAKTETEETK